MNPTERSTIILCLSGAIAVTYLMWAIFTPSRMLRTAPAPALSYTIVPKPVTRTNLPPGFEIVFDKGSGEYNCRSKGHVYDMFWHFTNRADAVEHAWNFYYVENPPTNQVKNWETVK